MVGYPCLLITVLLLLFCVVCVPETVFPLRFPAPSAVGPSASVACSSRAIFRGNLQSVARSATHPDVFRLRGGSKDAIEIDSAELARQREERKKAKAEEKLKKKLAKEARAECTAGGASGGVVGPTGDTEGASGDTAASCGGPEVSYTTAGGLPEAHFGNLRLVQSRDQDALPQSHLDTLRSLNSLAGFDVGQPVWVRARVQNVRFKGNSCFLVLRDGTDTLQATLFKSADVYILQKITRGDMMQ
jgi:hypothetical protein